MKKLGIISLNSLIILNILFSINCCAMNPQQKYGNCISSNDFLATLNTSKKDPKYENIQNTSKYKNFFAQIFVNNKYITSSDVTKRTDIFRTTDFSKDSAQYSITFNVSHLSNLSFSVILSDITLHHIFYGNYKLEKYEDNLELQAHSGGHTTLANELLKMICNSDQLDAEQTIIAKNHIEKIDYLFNEKICNETDIVKLIQEILTKLTKGSFYDNTLAFQKKLTSKTTLNNPKNEIHIYVKIDNIGYATNSGAKQKHTNWALLILKHQDDFPENDPIILYRVASFFPVKNIPDKKDEDKICITINRLKTIPEILKK